MKRFTLENGKWYACEMIGDEFKPDSCSVDCCSYTPIKVHGITPSHAGDRSFRLAFYHANYPEGARDKDYPLCMIERGANMLLARSLEHTPARILLFYDITAEWIRTQFPKLNPDERDFPRWLDKNLYTN